LSTINFHTQYYTTFILRIFFSHGPLSGCRNLCAKIRLTMERPHISYENPIVRLMKREPERAEKYGRTLFYNWEALTTSWGEGYSLPEVPNSRRTYTCRGCSTERSFAVHTSHAEIVNIQTEHAETLPGMCAAITYKDVEQFPDALSKPGTEPLQILSKTLYFVGDYVAAVVAENQDIAESALELIKVNYKNCRLYLMPKNP